MRPALHGYRSFYQQRLSTGCLFVCFLIGQSFVSSRFYHLPREYFLVRCSYRLIGWSEGDDPGAAGWARISVTSVTVRGSNFPQLRTLSAPDCSPFFIRRLKE